MSVIAGFALLELRQSRSVPCPVIKLGLHLRRNLRTELGWNRLLWVHIAVDATDPMVSFPVPVVQLWL